MAAPLVRTAAGGAPERGEAGHKLAELSVVAQSERPALLCVSESQLDATFADGQLVIPGYTLHRCDRDPRTSARRVVLATSPKAV